MTVLIWQRWLMTGFSETCKAAQNVTIPVKRNQMRPCRQYQGASRSWKVFRVTLAARDIEGRIRYRLHGKFSQLGKNATYSLPDKFQIEAPYCKMNALSCRETLHAKNCNHSIKRQQHWAKNTPMQAFVTPRVLSLDGGGAPGLSVGLKHGAQMRARACST